MGFFGSGKKVFVSSVVYNMAGDIEDRPNFLKTTVISKVLAPASASAQSMGQHIVSSYLHGPGLKLRRFGRWARLGSANYNGVVGMGDSTISVGNNIDDAVLETEIPHTIDEQVQVQNATIGVPNYTFWADQYMMENYPELINTNYVADFDLTTETVTITFEDTTTTTFMITDYDPKSMYLYVRYNVLTAGEEQDVVEGDPVILDPGDPFPDTTGWTLEDTTTTPQSVVLNTTVHTLVEYSDATPDEEDTDTTPSDYDYDDLVEVWERTDYVGRHPTIDTMYSLRQIMTQTSVGEIEEEVDIDVDVDVVGGVTITTTTTTTTESVVFVKSYQIDTQEILGQVIGPLMIYIYKYDSGNSTIDAMFSVPETVGEFLPIIPFRIDNQNITPSFKPEIYEAAVKATKKAMSTRYLKIQHKINDNPSLGDIDYAYVMFGCTLNSKEPTARKYIYRFFQEIMLGHDMGVGGFSTWKANWEAADESMQAWLAWKAGQDAELNPGHPLYGTTEPVKIPYPEPPYYSFQHSTEYRTDLNYRTVIHWAAVEEFVEPGLGKPDAVRGEIWFEAMGSESFSQTPYANGEEVTTTIQTYEKTRLYWQDEDDAYRYIDVYGLQFINVIYGSKMVIINAHEALADDDESGFIIPIHEEIFKSLSLVPGTQVSTACAYLVFNCYEVVREKWYATTAFKVFIVVLIIVIVIVSAGTLGPAAGGILGTNLAIGTALGATGTAALILGAIANAIAGMIVAQIISYAANAIFEPKVAAIVTVIATIITMQVGSALSSGAGIAEVLTSLAQPENLLLLTSTLGEGYAKYLQADATEIIGQTQELMAQNDESMRKINEQIQAQFGVNQDLANVLSITDTASALVIPESPDTFLTRTLLTGPEIATLSTGIIGSFSDLTLTTTLPT